MTTKQKTMVWVCDNLDSIKQSDCKTIAEAIKMNVTNDGTIDNWNEEEEGMTSDAFYMWVLLTYNFSADDEKAQKWAANIWYNEF